jgi:hypothetical protein
MPHTGRNLHFGRVDWFGFPGSGSRSGLDPARMAHRGIPDSALRTDHTTISGGCHLRTGELAEQGLGRPEVALLTSR